MLAYLCWLKEEDQCAGYAGPMCVCIYDSIMCVSETYACAGACVVLEWRTRGEAGAAGRAAPRASPPVAATVPSFHAPAAPRESSSPAHYRRCSMSECGAHIRGRGGSKSLFKYTRGQCRRRCWSVCKFMTSSYTNKSSSHKQTTK